MKNLFKFFLPLLIPFTLQAQLNEPKSFDWSESYVKNTKVRFHYDSEAINYIPRDAMFWVQIKPYSNKTIEKKIVKNGVVAFEDLKYLEKIRNGRNYNHGLYHMTKAKGKVVYATMFEKTNYKVSENSNTYQFNQEAPELYSRGGLNNAEQNFLNSEYPTFIENGILWFRDIENGEDLSIDTRKKVMKIRKHNGSQISNIYFEEVEEDIFRVSETTTIENIVNREGYCMKKEEWVEYSEHKFEINPSYPSGEENQLNRVKLFNTSLTGDGNLSLTIDLGFDEKSSILVSDIMGRIIYSDRKNNKQFLNLNLNNEGVYFIRLEANGEVETQKIYFVKQ